MPEPATTIGLAALAGFAAKDVVTRLLGPTADFLGGEMKEFAQRRLENVGRIFGNAAEKAKDQLNEPGAVPPRVLRDIINEGSFQDDGLTVEYFGGVLASSRTSMNRDDRSATFTGLISRLSTYQIRSHFIFYSVLRSIFRDQEDLTYDQQGREQLASYIPLAVYLTAMEFTEEEMKQLQGILEHSCFGLHEEGLIGQFRYGSSDLLPYKNVSNGIVFVPTVLGSELFLRVHGIQPTSAAQILSPNLNLTVKCQIPILPGSKPAK